jgi:hypothetical protein
MKQNRSPIESGLDLVLNVFGVHSHTAEVAWQAASLAAPHAYRHSPTQGSHVQSRRPWLPRGLFFVR